MTRGKNQHVYPHRNGGWAVENAGSKKPARVVDTLGEATNIAVKRAMKQNALVNVYGTDEVISYSKHL